MTTEPGPEEIARAIASITGQKIPPNPDAPLVAKLLQGTLAGMMFRAMHDRQGTLPIKVRDVDIPTDSEGNYVNYFILTTDGGIRLKVSIEPEESQ